MEKIRTYGRSLNQRDKAALMIPIISERRKIKVDAVKGEGFSHLSMKGPPYQILCPLLLNSLPEISISINLIGDTSISTTLRKYTGSTDSPANQRAFLFNEHHP